jgi:DNA-binding HxlR family transcriptional regulator
MDKQRRSNCPISLVLETIGDKWSLLVLRDLIFRGKKRYQEFLNSEEGISTNILAERLVRLEKHRLISKSDDPDNKKQIIYTPTKKALDLMPVLFEMIRWGIKYNLHIDLNKPLLKRMNANEKALRKEILSRFEEGPEIQSRANTFRAGRIESKKSSRNF